MVGRVVLGILLLAAGGAHAAEFVPLPFTSSPVWLQRITSQGGGTVGSSLEAPPGQQPERLNGVLTAGSFAAYADAFISSTEDSISIDVSGTATSYSAQGSNELIIYSGQIDVSIPLPASPQSVVQIFVDWGSLATSSGWTTNGSFDCGFGTIGVEGLGTLSSVGNVNALRIDPPPTWPTHPFVGAATVPSGEVLRTQCYLQLNIQGTARQTGPFHMAGTVRFRLARPLEVGDVDASGVVDLVDTVLLRRQLAELPVP